MNAADELRDHLRADNEDYLTELLDRALAEAAQGAAPRAEGLPLEPDVAWQGTEEYNQLRADDHEPCDRCYERGWKAGAAPRAEGLDVERLGQVIYEMGVDDLDLPDAQKLAAHIAARLSRPSDERVPEPEDR